MNTERTEKFVNAIACDLEEGGFRQVSGTTLRRTLATAVSAALPLLADTGIPTSQPAELAEQQGVNFDIDDVRELFEQWAKGRDLTPDTWGVTSYVSPHVDNDFDVWRAAWKALAATGKQQVGEVQGDALDVEWLTERISSIHSTVSLGHQTGPHAYAGEDFGRYLAEAAGDCRRIMRVLSDLAARQPVEQEPGIDGYQSAFYELAGMLEMGAQPITPKQAWETQMRPALQAALAARQPGAQEAVAYWLAVDKDGVVEFGMSADDANGGQASRQEVNDFINGPLHEGGVPHRLVGVYAATPAQGIDLAARPMDTAPRDGTLVRLLVDFDENAIEDSISATWTIGACNDDNVSEGARIGWQFAGWCWTHDHFTEGTGTPIGWLPLIDGQRDAAPGVGNG